MKTADDPRSENGQAPQSSPAPPAPLDDSRVIRALEEYQAAQEAGHKPDRHAFLARHPEIAEALAGCLAGLDFVQEVAPQLHSDASSPAEPRRQLTLDMDPELPLGDYRLVREVGRGGMGVVYEAVQLSLGRRVALKVLPFAAALDPRQLQRFKNEAQAAACLHHTNIVPVYGVGCERGVHFYAMQFIEGQTLAALIGELRQLAGRGAADEKAARDGAEVPVGTPRSVAPPSTQLAAALSTERSIPSPAFFRTVAQLGVQAAEALEHAHMHGIIHRDVKPANLLLDGQGNLWITDFGLARLQNESSLSLTGDLMGTLRYMSPEQALAKRAVVDHRTDVYSLGVTLYEFLILAPPFTGQDRQELLRQIAFDEPRPPRSIQKAIPPDLETVILKALAKEPEARYGTARELADDLHRILLHQPVRAKRAALSDRLWKWARRHQALVRAAAVFLILAVVGLTVGIVLLSRERAEVIRHRDEAERQAQRLRRQLYLSQMNLTYQAWERGAIGQMRELLATHEPAPGQADIRDFAWHYLHGLSRGGLSLQKNLQEHKGEVYCAAFSPDGALLATAGQDRLVRLWEVATWRVRAILSGHTDEINDLAFAPDGKTLATASDDRTVRFWDTEAARERPVPLHHSAQVSCLAFSPDGRTVATLGRDGRVRLWCVASGKDNPTLVAASGNATVLAFAPDGLCTFLAWWVEK